jgi:predicted membrane chloride channel (bestrophin family)
MVTNIDIISALSNLVKTPFMFALAIPIVLIYCATKFANATVESLILYGFISLSALGFGIWVIKQFIANGTIE